MTFGGDVENGGAEEKEHFLPNLNGDLKNNQQHDNTFGQDIPNVLKKSFSETNDGNKNESKETSEGCCKSCKCTWKLCGIITGVIILIVVIAILAVYFYYKKMMDDASVGGASSEDSDVWAERLGNVNAGDVTSIAGTYKLVSYTPNYEKYLSSFGMPSFIVGMLLKARESVTIVEPTEPGKPYKIITENRKYTNGEVLTGIA